MMYQVNLPELYILRHGETVWNAAGRMQGRFDSALTDRGVAQGLAMAASLASLGVRPETHRWISSPQGRAVATARLTLGGPDVGMIALDPRLTEIGMGDWAGLDRARIARDWPGPANEDMIAFYGRIPQGESFADLEARVGAFLADLTGPAVVVTHGMTSRFLRMVALGLCRADLLALPGGQGVIHHLHNGQARLIVPDMPQDILHPDGPTGIRTV